MSQSVASHLSLAIADYDREIRRFVPAYDQMIDEAASITADWVSPNAHILDLGAGTGALSFELGKRLPGAKLSLLDSDAAMLEGAKTRMSAITDRVTFRLGSFLEALPQCDAAVASLALHHVRQLDIKTALYSRIRGALRSAGILVVADATMPASPVLAERVRRRWAAHLINNGDSEAQAYARFQDWAREDTYFAIEQELAALRAAGFSSTELVWRYGPSTVIAATG